MTVPDSVLKPVEIAAQAAADKLADNIVAFDVSEQLSITDVFLIASAGISILVTAFWDEAVTFAGTNWRLVVIFASSLLLLRRTKLSPILVMTLAGAANLLLELLPFPS